MRETPYSAEELAAITAHFEAAQSAMRNGEETEALGRVGLPPGYGALAEAVYRSMLLRHGISIPGAALVMAGMTMGFALGRDFGHVEILEQTGEVRR